MSALLTAAACAWTSIASAGTRSIETTYYTLNTDVAGSLAEELVVRLDAMYREYDRRLADFSPTGDRVKSQVFVFDRRIDYSKLTEDRFPNTGGVFMPGKDLLAAFLEGQGRETLRRTLQHEAFHQFAHAKISPNLPPWLNEGLAQVFEEGIWTGDRFLLGQVPPRRVRQLQADMHARKLVPFETLLKYTDEQWSANMSDRPVAAVQYNQSWAMAHFLIYAAEDSGQPRYRGRLLDLLKAIHNGTDPTAAFRIAFSDNIKGFQDRFVEWSHSLEPTPEATYVENQTILGDMLVALAKDGARFDTIDDFRRKLTDGKYRLTYTRGQMVWNTSIDPGIYFKDLSARPLGTDRLYFDRTPMSDLPDLVCRAMSGIQFRTRTYSNGAKVDTEVIVEAR